MIKRLVIYFIVYALTGTSLGCGDILKVSSGKNKESAAAVVPAESLLLQPIDSTELAKILLKPKRKPLTMSRDPFKPLFQKEYLPISSDDINANTPINQSQNILEDIILVGVIKMGEESRVYLKSNLKSGVFRPHDKLGEYNIERIDVDQVVFKRGDNEFIIKRGEK